MNPMTRPAGPRNAVPTLASAHPPATAGKNMANPTAMSRLAQESASPMAFVPEIRLRKPTGVYGLLQGKPTGA